MVCCFASFVDGWASYNRQNVTSCSGLWNFEIKP